LTVSKNSHILWLAKDEMNKISDTRLGMIEEINRMWEPVYPHLARHAQEEYGRNDGVVLEIGPFCGVIFSLIAQGVGSHFTVGAFPPGIASFYRGWVFEKGCANTVDILETDQSLVGIEDSSADLIVFRGALFFPSLFQVDYNAIERIMKPGSAAMIGGGFGKFTPPDVILPIAERSKDLNLKIGKVEMTEDLVRKEIDASKIKTAYRIVRDGGFWVILNKG
jgi:hypothetical protein